MAKLTDYGNSIAGLRTALRRLPKQAGAELKDASAEIADDVATQARARAASLGGAWRHLGPTIRVARSSVPTVAIGGRKRLPGRKGPRQTVGDLTFGLEFGGGRRPTTQQFMPHLGQTGYALWPTVRERSDDIGARYSRALLDALEDL